MESFTPVMEMELDEENEIWTPGLNGGKRYFELTTDAKLVNCVYQFLICPARMAFIGHLSGLENVVKAYPNVIEHFLDKAMEQDTKPEVDLPMSTEKYASVLQFKKTAYLLNLDKLEFVNLQKYQDPDKIDVLPFLTIVTNSATQQLTYHAKIPFDGHWAYDMLQVTQHLPDGFVEISPDLPSGSEAAKANQ